MSREAFSLIMAGLEEGLRGRPQHPAIDALQGVFH